MNLIRITFILIAFGSFCAESHSHESTSKAHYLGNEGVMVVNGGVKILFDPFFHSSFGYYTLVPE